MQETKGIQLPRAMGTSFVGYFTFVLLLLALTKVRGGPAYNSPLSSDLSDLKVRKKERWLEQNDGGWIEANRAKR